MSDEIDLSESNEIRLTCDGKMAESLSRAFDRHEEIESVLGNPGPWIVTGRSHSTSGPRIESTFTLRREAVSDWLRIQRTGR